MARRRGGSKKSPRGGGGSEGGQIRGPFRAVMRGKGRKSSRGKSR